jgi:DNA-binding transcriptional ArsR family regulator
MPVRPKESSVDRLFGALANPTRRDILDALLGGEQTAGDIAARFTMARPSVSEHLTVLADCGLVTERRDGRSVWFTIVPAPLAQVGAWLSPYERYWRERMHDLSTVLNEMDDND